MEDLDRATSILSHVKYYRLSGYCLAFEVRRHRFCETILLGTKAPRLEQASIFMGLTEDWRHHPEWQRLGGSVGGESVGNLERRHSYESPS